jgi:hypothetical protein
MSMPTHAHTPPKAPTLPKVPGAGARAREQAQAYESVFAPLDLQLDNGDILEIPPHPNLRLLDDDRQEAYEELLFETESYDRHPDIYIPEQQLTNGVVLPAETKRGELLIPYRRDGQLIKPPYTVRVVQVCLGDEKYEQLKVGGKRAADVWRLWNESAERLQKRQQEDSKSNDRAHPLGGLSR